MATIMVQDQADGYCLITLEGRLDVTGSSAIELRFSAAAGAKKFILVDLTNVSFLASIGIRSLVLGAKAVHRKSGKMIIAAPQANVLEVLQSTGIDKIIPCLATVDEGRALLSVAAT